MTPQPPTPSRRAAGGDTPLLVQVANTLEHCRVQVRLSSKAIKQEYDSGNRAVMLVWNRVNDAWAHLDRALSELEEMGIHPAAVPATDAPRGDETACEGDGMPKRVRVVKAGSPEYWYARNIGQTFEVTGTFFNDETMTVAGYWVIHPTEPHRRDTFLVGMEDCEPATIAPESGREHELLNAVEALLTYREHNTLNWQLEKADDYFRSLRQAREAYPLPYADGGAE